MYSAPSLYRGSCFAPSVHRGFFCIIYVCIIYSVLYYYILYILYYIYFQYFPYYMSACYFIHIHVLFTCLKLLFFNVLMIPYAFIGLYPYVKNERDDTSEATSPKFFGLGLANPFWKSLNDWNPSNRNPRIRCFTSEATSPKFFGLGLANPFWKSLNDSNPSNLNPRIRCFTRWHYFAVFAYRGWAWSLLSVVSEGVLECILICKSNYLSWNVFVWRLLQALANLGIFPEIFLMISSWEFQGYPWISISQAS